MRDWKKNKIINFMSAIILAVSLLSGCKQERLEEETNVPQENVSGQEEVSGLRKFFKDTEWKAEWKATMEDGSERKISVDADITVPDVEVMSVIEIEKLAFTNENKETFLKELFDDSDAYYNDDTHKTKEQWQKKIEREIQSDLEWEKYDMTTFQDEESKEITRERILRLENRKAEYEEKVKNAPTEYTKADKFDTDSYLGYINGQPYTIMFNEYNDSQTNEGEVLPNEIIMEHSDYEKMMPEELKNTWSLHRSSFSDDDIQKEEYLKEKNRCEMSKQEAESYAQRYLEAVGIPGGVCTDIKDLYWIGYEKDEENNNDGTGVSDICIPDGYEITFVAGVDGSSLNPSRTEEMYSGFDDVSGNTVAVVEVSDEGLIYMRVQNPIKICNITSNVELLSLDNIYEIIKGEMTQNSLNHGNSDNITFEELELIYFRVADKKKKNHFSYIPVWRLGFIIPTEIENYKFKQWISKEVVVNAIDGSLIYPLDE